MNNDTRSDDPRKPYERPVLKAIELAAEEVLAVGCKGPSLGLASGSMMPPCMVRNCARSGS